MSTQRIAIVTGAARGIGAATAKRLAEAGHSVPTTGSAVHAQQRRSSRVAYLRPGDDSSVTFETPFADLSVPRQCAHGAQRPTSTSAGGAAD